jgi:aspartyl aminopeptidase
MSNAFELIEFIKESPTAYHTVDTVKRMLVANGYTECSEKDHASFSDGGKHFVIRNGTSLIAFRGKHTGGFMICASHSDTPALKLKSEINGTYARASVEKYGGSIFYSWLDRPLSVAGRITVRTEDGIETKLVNIDRDLLTIPSVAIHFNRTVNDGYKFNPAVDMLPRAGSELAHGKLELTIAEAAGVEKDRVISRDLFVYNRDEGKVIGTNGELILAPRLDDLACVYSSVKAFLGARDNEESTPVLAIFDNEEVGSETKQGAASTFLDMTLSAIAGSDSKYRSSLFDSFMLSADNAHAIHPNHPELSDSVCAPKLCGGVVVKYNANQRYTTDAVSDGVFRVVAERAGVKLQSYANRADMLGGSTLGSIANTAVSIKTIDIGLPQLAMHSATETISISDLSDMVSVIKEFYSTALVSNGENIKIKN